MGFHKTLLGATVLLAIACGGSPDDYGVEAEDTLQDSQQSLKKTPDVGAYACQWAYAATTSWSSAFGAYQSAQLTTGSGCGHIWLKNYVPGRCDWVRIRYYPSSGASFLSGSQYVCSTSWASFSNDVLAGTRFRVESSTYNAQFNVDF